MSDTILLSKHTEELTSLSTQHKDAVSALETKHKDTVTALQKKVDDAVSALAVATEKEKTLTSALAAKAAEVEEAGKYDMRKAGAPALQIALDTQHGMLPKPANTDAEKWSQYTALCELTKDDRGNVTASKETPSAKRFKDMYLTRK